MVDVDAPLTLHAPARRRALAVGLAVASVAVALIGTVLWMLLLRAAGDRPALAGLALALGSGVAPLLATASIIVLLRMRGALSPSRTAALLALASLALPLVALTAASWGLGFADADAGRPVTGFAAATVPLGVAALLLVAVLFTLLLQAVVGRTGIGSASAWALSVVCGALGAPVLVGGLAAPPTGAGIAVGALVIVVLTAPAGGAGARAATAPRPAPDARDDRLRGAVPPARRARALVPTLARFALVAGALGVAVALTGSAWWPVPIDGTQAMGVGISILLAAALPLVAALAVLALDRVAIAPAVVSGSAAALALALAVMALWYTGAPAGAEHAWALPLASLLLGVAVGGMSLLLPIPRSAAIVVGLAVALTLGVQLAAMLLPALAFATPLVAAALLVLGRRTGRPEVPRPESAPTPTP
ncbi:hypothetical protein [Microcella alkalica]|uniref:hypothetical protein n=1 Tax=Microcella alkalica TaxID=355930 RepID=UPI00145CD017|nr:hypothetical protein [Microcella alkalica]